jgi:hypothetical protein
MNRSPVSPTANPVLLYQDVDSLVEPYRTSLRRTIPLLILAVAAAGFWRWEQESYLAAGAAWLVIILATIPAILWLAGYLKGIPILPGMALHEVLVFGLPVLAVREGIEYYTEAEILRACVAEIIYLGILTTVAILLSRGGRKPSWVIALTPAFARPDTQVRLCISLLLLATIFSVSVPAGWAWTYVYSFLPNGVFVISRAAFALAALVGIFFMALAHGSGILPAWARTIYIALTMLYMAGQTSTLLIAGLLFPYIAWFCGFTLGRGRFPWIVFLLSLIVLNILHLGKWEMRYNYWEQFGGTPRQVSPLDYPNWYGEWFRAGIRGFSANPDFDHRQTKESFLDRASLVQMVLLAQTRAPREVPHLSGRTYWIIPQLFVPRLLWPEKPRTHLGQITLNVHFGRQTEEQAQRSFIAWGMLAESWANFGWLGPPLLGVVFGFFVGGVTRLSRGVPLGSLRFLLATLILFTSISASSAVMSVYLTTLFQAVVVILVASVFVMRRIPNPS